MKVANILALSGKFVTVKFVKNDGTVRTINGRVGVKKYIKGTGTARSLETQSKYLLVWAREGSPKFDHAKNVAIDRIVSIRANGVSIERNDSSDFARFV